MNKNIFIKMVLNVEVKKKVPPGDQDQDGDNRLRNVSQRRKNMRRN
jgi:hypothetical protein